jgi:kinesin family protein 11
MVGFQRPQAQSRNAMRPPPRPNSQAVSRSGREQSPANSIAAVRSPGAGVKRKEREFDQDGGEETNIHVVVRCRGRSDREVKENSGVVVSTTGVKAKNVELSMGPNAISNKTYNFDKVFSPAADQSIIFEDVVQPILNEMITGYNCTIFAYGQTGTGKTYTMSGDMTDTLGLLSDAAGIIPRVLYSLFARLEADGVECSVKCSFIELYNEELRDLLSADDTAKLKIYDDQTRKSQSATMVQGMEESHIKTAAAGIQLLQAGSHRRQVAATKCNDLSSRSHTVFTITTFIKKASEAGEDYICAGKLNLVDLAGSENIQRSGAENKRAAEAGLINKSLLTLGRVINALVDKSSHIPYRESKLTRLLQDSLGGRTKTCIIATVSPARSNLEETISTLDYAFRAKNIRNKPQVNSMINKKTLLREFTAEIEKLKSELIATRQRNGVYLSNEQYEEITVESESRRILSEEQKSRIETMENSLRNKVQELFSLTNNFQNLKKNNEGTRTILENTKDVLVQTEIVLQNTRQNLAEETALREAHQTTENQLQTVGNGLISTLNSSVNDLGGLHAKIRRREDLHDSNKFLWQSSVSQVFDVSSLVDAKIQTLQERHAGLLASLSERIDGFVTSTTAGLAQSQHSLESRQTEHSAIEKQVVQQSSKARDGMNNVLEEIKVLREEVKDRVGEGLQGLSEAAAKISGEVITELDEFHTQLHSSYAGLGRDFKAMFEDITRQLSAQKEEAKHLRAALSEATRQHIEATCKASDQLSANAEADRLSAQLDRQNLMAQITALIEASAAKHDERVEANVRSTQANLAASTSALQQADKTYGEGMDRWIDHDSKLLLKVHQSKDELKAKMKNDWIGINTRNAAIQTSTKAVHQETVKIVDAQLKEMATQMAALDQFVTRARSQNDQHHTEHVHSLQTMSSSVDETFTQLQQGFVTTASSTEVFKADLNVHTSAVAASLTNLDQEIRQPLSTLTSTIESSQLAEYIPTGETPQKREWEIPSTLPQTEPHERLLARMRGLPDPTVAKTPSSARTPGRSPRKGMGMTSPRKANQSTPSKLPSPSKRASPMKNSPIKGKVYTDVLHAASQPILSRNDSGLREIDVNVIPRPVTSAGPMEVGEKILGGAGHAHPHPVRDFAKSVNSAGQPSYKRHAAETMTAKVPLKGEGGRTGRSKSKENNLLSSSVGPGSASRSGSLGCASHGRRLRSSPNQEV